MIKPLTSLRFFFAMMVLTSHYFAAYHRLFYEGFVGVSFFYILSGFVLSYSYFDRLSKGVVSKKDFYVARVARIYPLHLLTFFISLLLSYKVFFSQIGTALLNVALLQSFVPLKSVYFSFNAVSWSISDEMFFYLLFPFFLFLVMKVSKGSKIVLLFFIFSLLILALNVVLPNDYKHAILYINPVIRFFDFMIGMMLYRVWVLAGSKRDMKYLKASVLELLSLIFFAVCLYFSKYVEINYRYSVYYWPAISFIILSFSIQKGFFSKLMSTKLMILLGEGR